MEYVALRRRIVVLVLAALLSVTGMSVTSAVFADEAPTRLSVEEGRIFPSDDVLAAFHEAAHDDALWERASRDPRRFFSERDIDIPEDVVVGFQDTPVLPDPMTDPPAPDWEKLGVIGWCTFWYCTHDGDLDGPGPKSCERISIAIFAR